MATYFTTNLPVICLNRAQRTGSLVHYALISPLPLNLTIPERQKPVNGVVQKLEHGKHFLLC